MRTGNASGFQIVFLSFAVILLAVPLSSYISGSLGSSPAEAAFIGRSIPFALGALVLLAFPPLRNLTVGYLSKPIPEDRRAEVAVVAIAKVPLGFAFLGVLALWYWLTEGNVALERHLTPAPRGESLAEAFSMPGVLTFVLLGAIVAPLIEEILYRGLLFDAWSRRWGGFTATVLTSALFASYHPHFFAAFASAVVFVCVVRRTGTLWASIAVHSFFNLMMWYPLAGQFVIPDPSRALGDISTWGFNLACLLFAAIALPIYIWMAARHPYKPADETA